jgi:hypothetical protein
MRLLLHSGCTQQAYRVVAPWTSHAYQSKPFAKMVKLARRSALSHSNT